MYLGEVQQRQSGNTWSTMTWSNTTGGGAGSWVAGSQAKFTSSGTYTVDASVSFSGLQFLNTSGTVTLNSSGSGALVLSSGGGALHTGARAVTINAPITGGGNSADTCEFAKTGSSTLTLGGNNTFSGNLIIAQGALKATNANALAGPVVTLNNSNSLTFGTGINNFNIGGLAGSGNLALTNVSTLTVGGNSFTTGYSGILSGSASVVKQGTGDWILSGANTYSGATTINGGSIVMGNDQALGNNTASTITLAGGALALNGSNLYGHQLNIASSQSTLANWNTGTTSVCSPNSVTVGSDFVVCGTGNIDVYGSFSASQKRTVTKGSSGVLTLSGNTDNAHLSVYARGGTVQLNKQPSSNSPDVHAVAWIDGIDSGATVQYSGTENYQVWQGGTITLNGGTLDFNGRSQTGTTMYINADESKIVNTAAAGTTIFYSPNSITVAPSVGRFCVDATDNIDLQTSIICDNSAGVYTHLQKTGAGQVRLSGAAANTLLTVDALGGTIALNKGTADGVYATYCASAGPGGTIRYLAGGDHQIQQSGWVHMEGGTIDLYGHNQTGTDLTVMTAGSTIANSAAGTTSVYTPNTMTINADMNVNTAGNLTINGQMSGPGALTKHGNGSLTLGGSNAYRGTTTISAGTLRLSGSGRIVSSSGITLNSGGTLLQDNGANSLDRTITLSGGTLGGTATYSFPTSNGTLTVGNSSHLSPGDPTIDGGNGYGIGTFTLAGAGAWTLGMNSSTVLDYDFGTAAGVSDLLQVSGGTSRSVILDGVLNISGSSVLAGRYAIISGATGIDDHGLSFGMVPTTHDWSYSIEKIGGTYSVVVTASPEPSTNILLAFAALCIVCWFRRSMRKIA
jgi:autotransporter-associated beta strand protein